MRFAEREGFSVLSVAKERAEKTMIAACGGKAPGLKPPVMAGFSQG
jgi:hypothetical protein